MLLALSCIFCATKLIIYEITRNLLLFKIIFILAAAILNNINENVEPCENFYEFACGGWLKKQLIPDDRSSVSVFSLLQDDLDQLLRCKLEFHLYIFYCIISNHLRDFLDKENNRDNSWILQWINISVKYYCSKYTRFKPHSSMSFVVNIKDDELIL